MPNRKFSKLILTQNVIWQYQMWPSRKVGDENFVIVSVIEEKNKPTKFTN